ncbi:MAG: hypothetical protein ACT4OD_04230, partial [Candidatus Nitrosotenuis sp.]
TALISIIVEHALIDIGKTTLDKVGNRLYEKYDCYFHDCLEHPEYLKDVLEDVFGSGSNAIVQKITDELTEFKNQTPISNFILVISK